MPFPPSLSASRLPDVDVDPLTLVRDPARLFLATFSSIHSRKNDGEMGMRTFFWTKVTFHGYSVPTKMMTKRDQNEGICTFQFQL